MTATVDTDAPADEVEIEAAETSANADTPESSARSDSSDSSDTPDSSGSADEKPKRGRPKNTAKKTRTVELVLTVTGTLDGNWQADVVHGTKRVVSGLTIPAAAVSRAAQELHPDVAKAIDSVISDAREQHEARLRELEAEVAKVKQALADLGDTPAD
jgi:hypothetical protein